VKSWSDTETTYPRQRNYQRTEKSMKNAACPPICWYIDWRARRLWPPMEEICLFFQAVKLKDDTGKSCCRSRNVLLAPLGELPQGFKELFENPPFLVKSWSYNNLFAFMSMGVSLTQWPDWRENGKRSRIICLIFEQILHMVVYFGDNWSISPSVRCGLSRSLKKTLIQVSMIVLNESALPSRVAEHHYWSIIYMYT